MATTAKPPVLVVLQLSGGNDYMNTVVPYKDPLYWDYRPRVALPEDQILLLDNDVGLHPSMGPIRDMYNQGKVAIIHGVGYPNSVNRNMSTLSAASCSRRSAKKASMALDTSVHRVACTPI